MPSTPEVILDSLADLQAAFDNVTVGSDGGRWRAVASGSTATAETGPGSNNILGFVHTETSGTDDISLLESRGIIDMQSDEIPDGFNRMLNVRLCIQGDFGDGTEGLQILTRVDDAGTWVEAAFIYGWAFNNSYVQGETFNDENGVERTVAADGGWVDFSVAIPDAAGQIEFRPHYIDTDETQRWQHDLALRSFFFDYDDQAAQQDPTVVIDTSAQEVDGGDTVSLAATVTDEQDVLADITLLWTATGGTFADDSIEDAVWTAPAATLEDQLFTLTLTATDTDANSASDSVVITVTARDLALADIAIPDGRELVGTASLIVVGASGDVYNTTDATVAEGPDPPTLIAANLNVTRIYLTGRTQLRISEDGLGNPETTFAAGGAQENFQVHVQTSPTAVVSLGRDDIDAVRSTETRLLLGADLDPDGVFSDVAALAAGDRVIWFITDDANAITTRDAGVSARAGSPTAAIGAQRQAITTRDAGVSARAGSPTAAIGAQRQAITTRDAGVSARAGSPTAAIGAQRQAITTRDAGLSARAGNPTAAIGADLKPDDVTSLLPPGKTPLEIALEAAAAPRVSPDAIRDLWNALKCPEPLLPWLAWAVSVDYWDDAWTVEQKRAVIEASIQIHLRKGTVSAMRLACEAAGLTFEIREWWQDTPAGTPGTASLFLSSLDGTPIRTEQVDLARSLLEGAKRATLHLTIGESVVFMSTANFVTHFEYFEAVSIG